MRKQILSKEATLESVTYELTVEHEGDALRQVACNLTFPETEMSVKEIGNITISGGILLISLPETAPVTTIYNNFQSMYNEALEELKENNDE